MKNKVKKTITAACLIMAILLSLMLTGCADTFNAADSVVKEFTEALASDDFETASSLMLPAYRATPDDLRDMVTTIEQAFGVNFSDGVIFDKTVNMGIYYSVNIPLGPLSEITFDYDVTVSGVKLGMKAAIVNTIGDSGLTDFLFSSRTQVGTSS